MFPEPVRRAVTLTLGIDRVASGQALRPRTPAEVADAMGIAPSDVERLIAVASGDRPQAAG